MDENRPSEEIQAAREFDAKMIAERIGIRAPVEYARELDDETEDGEEIRAEIFWLRFPANSEYGTDSTEVKLYMPENPNGEAIIFTPGYPGAESGRFEHSYAKKLIDEGYALSVVRHNSVSLDLDGELAQNIINSPQRQQDAKEDDQHHIGPTKENGYTWDDINKGTIPVILAFAPRFTEIHMIGHSFGAASTMISLSEIYKKEPEILEKVGNFISLAGFLGRDEEVGHDKTRHGLKMSIDPLIEDGKRKSLDRGVDIAPTEDYKEGIISTTKLLEDSSIPDSIGQVLVLSPDDPNIASPVVKTNEGVINHYDYPGHTKKTLYIEDETHDDNFHMLPNLRAETLLRLIRMKVSSKGPHYVKVQSKEPKQENYETTD